jgi:hypothetical protein
MNYPSSAKPARILLGILAGLACSFAAQASVVFTTVTNDANTVSYQISITGPASNQRTLYIDVDSNSATGFPSLGMGADYIISEGKLLKYAGPRPNWAWTEMAAVSYVYDPDTNVAQWVVPRDLLGSPATLKLLAYVRYLDNTVETSVATPQTMSANAPALLRDPLKQPFASNSIWNRPIGTDAQYVPAGLVANPGVDESTPMPQIDNEQIVLRADAPLLDIKYNGVAWTGGDRCPATGATLATVPVPDNFVVPNSKGNNAASFLMRDGRTVLQSQPFTRCVAGPGTVATSLLTFPPVDLYGPGITGAHGGSNLSSLGGSIRLGELRPNTDPSDMSGPRHTLKLNVDSRQALHSCATQAECYVWPASKADSGASGPNGDYGKNNPNAPLEMRMGALLAIPNSVSIASLGLESVPGKQLAWTLQNYGAYIADSTGGAAYAFSAEAGADGDKKVEFQNDWGTPMQQRINDHTAWSRDVARIIVALQVVTNNTKANGPSGGGRPLQSFLPELPK